MAEDIPSPPDAVPPEESAAPETPDTTVSAISEPMPVDAGSALGVDAAADPASGDLDASAIDELLKAASFDDPSPGDGGNDASDELGGFKLPDFQQVMQDAQVSSIDLLRDVDLDVKIELGRSRMLVEDVLKLAEGSVVELDKLAGDPVDVFVNERLVARGEVLVLNDNFCVRINEIVAGVRVEGV